jgi:hypothetical protein
MREKYDIEKADAKLHTSADTVFYSVCAWSHVQFCYMALSSLILLYQIANTKI